jgi:peptidyl-prolyl cis-trans isomerase D
MMRQLRDKRTMQVILWGLLVAFLFTIFVAWGMKYTGVGADKDPNLLAQVGGTQITFTEVENASQRDLDRLYAEGENPSNETISALRQEALDHLIDQAILENAGKKMGISVSTEELAADLQREPTFMDQNQKFDKNRYYQFLQSRQVTPEQFEASLREQMLMQKIQIVLKDSVLYTPAEVDDYTSFLGRDLKAVYVELNAAKLKAEVPLVEEELKTYYESNKTQFDHPERLKLRHILLSLREGTVALSEDGIKKKLEGFRADILSKKSKFEDIAKKFSDDPGSKAQGGELGWFAKGGILKELEDAALKLQKGEISTPVKTQYGYHLIQLEDRENAYQSVYSEVRPKVVQKVQAEGAAKKTAALSLKLSVSLKKNKSLEIAAKEAGLPVQATAWFNRETGVPGLKDSKNLADILAGYYPKDWRGPLTLNENSYFFQITEAKPGKIDPQTLAKKGPETAQRLTSYKEQEWLKNFLAERRKELKVKSFPGRI